LPLADTAADVRRVSNSHVPTTNENAGEPVLLFQHFKK